jgi:hypothetical protein
MVPLILSDLPMLAWDRPRKQAALTVLQPDAQGLALGFWEPALE